MQKISIAIMALSLLMFAGCKQDGKPRVRTRYDISKTRIIDEQTKMDTTYITGGITHTYEYDDTGKIILNMASDGSKIEVTTTGNKVITVTTDSTGKKTNTLTEFMNSKKAPDSSVTSQNNTLSCVNAYTYNADGNRTETRQYEPIGKTTLRLSFIIQYAWKDGNVLSEKFITPGSIDTLPMFIPAINKWGTMIRTVTATETETHFNYFTGRPDLSHLSSNSKDLIKNSFELDAHKDTMQFNLYRYKFDDKGRVISNVKETSSKYKTEGALEYDSTAYTYY